MREMMRGKFHRPILFGIIVASGSNHIVRRSTFIDCQENTSVSTKSSPSPTSSPSKGGWYPGKYANDFVTSLVYSEDDIHFMKYMNSSENNKGLMSWPSMQKGIQLRSQDEQLLHELLSELQSSSMNKEELGPLYTRKIEDILYGKGLTAKDREEYLMKYGCAAYTPEALQLISDYAGQRSKYEGIIEIGAGYGQWARVLHDKYQLKVKAFDSMSNLPKIDFSANNNNEFVTKYLYQSIQKGTERVLDRYITEKTHQDFDISKHALMIIYPDPSKMAYQSLVKYSENHSLIWNDLFIYVGEGRHGANADHHFFDTLEGLNEEGKQYKWKLVKTCSLRPFGGHNSKGFERLFIFKRDLQQPKKRFAHVAES
jgi:hypothetical protein